MDKQITAGTSLKIGSEEIESEDQVKLVGVFIDNKLSYNEYISSYLKQSGAKMNSIKRLGNFISKTQKKILCYSYVLLYFKYCPIVGHFGCISNIQKIEKLHERVIGLIHSDYIDCFTLLNNPSLRTLHANKLENICIEIYKIKNGLNPKFFLNVSYLENLGFPKTLFV